MFYIYNILKAIEKWDNHQWMAGRCTLGIVWLYKRKSELDEWEYDSDHSEAKDAYNYLRGYHKNLTGITASEYGERNFSG